MKRLLQTALMLGLLGLASLRRLKDSSSDSDSNSAPVLDDDRNYNCSCGWANKDLRRIVSGNKTRVNEYPMMAGIVILEQDSVVCGGTILTIEHVVTAAHCLDDLQPSGTRIFVGPHYYNKVRNAKHLLKPKMFYKHEKYVRLTLKYDIAIILMKKPIRFSINVGPVCLPTASIPLTQDKVKLLGWGQTSYKGNSSQRLQQVYVDVVDMNKCEPHYPQLELNDRHQMCTFTENKDACKGDAGGPVLWRDLTTSKYSVLGIISYGRFCGKLPAVNIDIVKFLPWMQKIISETGDGVRTCSKVN